MINKNALTVAGALIVYYFAMELYYYYFIGRNYDVYRFYLQPDAAKYIETKVIFILVLFFSLIISRRGGFIYANFILLIVFFLVPTLVIYAFSDQLRGPLYSILALLLCVGLTSMIKVSIPQVHTTQLSYGLITFILILSIIPFVITFGINFNLTNLLLADISQSRDFFEQNSSSLMNYLYNWLVKALFPLLMIFFLIKKRYLSALITVFLFLYLYIISGNKIVYITLMVVLFFQFVGDDYYRKAKYFVFFLIAGLAVLPLVDYYVLNSHSLKGIFVMRMLFLPSQLNYYYFDFFAGSPLYFAESNFFKLFVEYPFDRPVGYVISQTYFSASGMNANNGIIGDGYMNLGYWGIALNIAIVSAIFMFFNSLDLDARYLGIFFLMIFLFLSVPMLSMFLTSGLWILCVMGLTIMRQKEA